MVNFLITLLLLGGSMLNAGIPIEGEYHGPTQQFIARETWGVIEEALLEENIAPELFSFFEVIAAEEGWGHIGYHGANHEYRIYQDVIRITIEEIVGIPIRENFHFLRVPGDDDLELNSIHEFFSYWGENNVDNRDELRAKQLLSLNFSLYANYTQPGSCSVCLFNNDRSCTVFNYAKMLTPFYKKLGISTKKLNEIFKIGNRWLKEKTGTLMQISENSHVANTLSEAYNFADGQCYPALRGGFLYDSNSISSHYQMVMEDSYVNKKSEIAPQARLLINNRHTLNPYSYLSIKRWEFRDEETIAFYEKELRDYIRQLKYDKKKVGKYRAAMLRKWQ